MRSMKRILSLLLALVLVAGYFPQAVRVQASQEDGLCPEHHETHDENCHYVAAVQGQECNHTTCDETCLTKAETNCVFPHEGCGCAPAVQGQSCREGSSCAVNEAGEMVHEDDCGYVAEQAAVTCGPECTPL